MVQPLARLNEPDYPFENMETLQKKLSPELVSEICNSFGLVGDESELRYELAKVLTRYQNPAKSAHVPDEPLQNKELETLRKSIKRTLAAFDAVSKSNKSAIDGEILYRPPFNRKFYFKEQIDYWNKNEGSVDLAILKLKQASWAIEQLKTKRASQGWAFKKTKNTPLDHLIKDLTLDFERGSMRKAKKHCYYSADRESYAGQYFEFVKFILDRFAPSSYHSDGALGIRIIRVLK